MKFDMFGINYMLYDHEIVEFTVLSEKNRGENMIQYEIVRTDGKDQNLFPEKIWQKDVERYIEEGILSNSKIDVINTLIKQTEEETENAERTIKLNNEKIETLKQEKLTLQKEQEEYERIERERPFKKTSRKCPHCNDGLYRRKDPYRMVCDEHGNVTMEFYHSEVKRRFEKKLQEQVEFKYSLKCTECYTEYSHPLKHCVKCSGNTKKIDIDTTYGKWIYITQNKQEFEKRLNCVINGLHFIMTDILYPDMEYQDRNAHYREILGFTA